MTAAEPRRWLDATDENDADLRRVLESAHGDGGGEVAIERLRARLAPLLAGGPAGGGGPAGPPTDVPPSLAARGLGKGAAASGPVSATSIFVGIALVSAAVAGLYYGSARLGVPATAPTEFRRAPRPPPAPPVPGVAASPRSPTWSDVGGSPAPASPPVLAAPDVSAPVTGDAEPGLASVPARRRRLGPAAASPAVSRAADAHPSGSAPERAPAAASSTLALEAELIARAQRLMPVDPAGALAVLDDHRERFGAGALVQERETLAIEALALTGRHEAAVTRLAAFAADHPRSRHLPRLRALVGTRGRSPAEQDVR